MCFLCELKSPRPAAAPQRPYPVGSPRRAYLLAGWDLALMPFALNESTRFISPTKTPEYMACGLPVVSTPIRDVVDTFGRLGSVRIAGTASAAPIIAIMTTVNPASAKDCKKYWGKNAIESITTATVRPEKSTVLPADATVLATDSPTELPAARSSRKRFTTSRL